MSTNAKFEAVYEDLLGTKFVQLSLYFVIPIQIAYMVFDVILAPSHWKIFVIIRLIECGLTYYFAELVKEKRLSSKKGMLVLSTLVIWTMIYMGYVSEGLTSVLYFQNGCLQVLIGSMMFIPWRTFIDNVHISLAALIPYYSTRPFMYDATIEEIVAKFFFDVFVLTIAFLSNRSFAKVQREAFDAKLLIERNIQSKDELIREQVSKITTQERELLIKENEAEGAKKLSLLAAQVAHDIRSPLTALNLAITDLAGMPEDRRSLVRHAVQRINDISNNLLASRRAHLKENLELQRRETHKHLLSGIIDYVISEKRSIIADKQLDIQLSFDRHYPPAFISFAPHLFANAFANLLQNAIDVSKQSSSIKIRGESNDTIAKVSISDFGGGIPDHILERLGKTPITFGKDQGNGLGVYNSVERIRSIGGRVDFKSTKGIGTDVEIIVPTVPTPVWVAREIKISEYKQVVICDDDSSIHDIWRNRLKDTIKQIHYYSLFELSNWLKANDIGTSVFLIDYEFANKGHNGTFGTDIIKAFSLQDRCFLVTSRYEEETVIQSCINHKIKLIPKFLAPYVPLK